MIQVPGHCNTELQNASELQVEIISAEFELCLWAPRLSESLALTV